MRVLTSALSLSRRGFLSSPSWPSSGGAAASALFSSSGPPRPRKVYGDTIRWGILSAGKISSDFANAIAITDGAEAAAVAARSSSKASSFAERHSIPKSYGSYDDLINDPYVDVVYVGSIADEHHRLASMSIAAGKPTVVEKPLTVSLRETEELIGLARKTDTFLMEGMWTRCFPAVRKARDLIASGSIGDVTVVQGDFGWSTSDCPYPRDRIWDPSSGGMTLDVGMYMAQLGGVAYPNGCVESVQAVGALRNGVDHTALANVKYGKSLLDGGGGGVGMLQFYVTGDANTEERVLIQGTGGRIVLDPPAHVPRTVRLYRDLGRGRTSEEVMDYPPPDDSYADWNYPGSVGFTYQIREVGDALRNGERECRHFTWKDSLQVASILDEILSQVHGDEDEGGMVEAVNGVSDVMGAAATAN